MFATSKFLLWSSFGNSQVPTISFANSTLSTSHLFRLEFYFSLLDLCSCWLLLWVSSKFELARDLQYRWCKIGNITYTNPDCDFWSNDPNISCFDCQSCKADLLHVINSDWDDFYIFFVLSFWLLAMHGALSHFPCIR